MGQLGDGTKDMNKNFPVQVKGLNNIIEVDSSGYNSIALKADGTVWTWGDNATGQLGSDRTNGEFPEQVKELSDVKLVSSGGSYSLAIKKDGTVVAWGYDKYINFCVDGYVDSPGVVQGIKDIIAIAGSTSGIIALKNDGTVWSWGNVDTPEQVKDLTDIVSIDKGHKSEFVTVMKI